MWLLFGGKFDNTFLHLLLLSHHLFINSFIPFYTHIPTFQLYLTLWNPMDCSPPGSSVHGIFQATILKWVAMPSSRGSSWPRDWIQVSYVSSLAGGFFTTSATWKVLLHIFLQNVKHCFPLLLKIFVKSLVVFLISISFLIFNISFLLLTLGFVPSFSNPFRWWVRLFELFLVSWGRLVLL